MRGTYYFLIDTRDLESNEGGNRGSKLNRLILLRFENLDYRKGEQLVREGPSTRNKRRGGMRGILEKNYVGLSKLDPSRNKLTILAIEKRGQSRV